MGVQLYVFDLDGVLYRMDEPIHAAVQAVGRLQGRGCRVFYITNNSSKSRADYVRKLGAIGVRAAEEEVMTSGYALGQWFLERNEAGRTVYVIGESGLLDELGAAGMRIVDYSEKETADYVAVGWDRQFSYEKLANAHISISRGSKFIATNRDATFPDAGGRTLPGSGSLVAALVTSTGVQPIAIGKPEPYTLDLILRRTGVSPDQCMVIGDRIDTDIAIGKRVGARTALVLTGIHTRWDLERYPDLTPDLVLESLAELQRLESDPPSRS